MPKTAQPATKSRPNVLILFTDQQRYDTVAAAGFPHMITPNLDRLVREGCLYTHGHTPNPVCVPARHNLLTGLPARYHGFSSNAGPPMDASIPTLPRILSDHGYETRSVGKMHFKPPRRHHGLDRMELMKELPRFREEDDYAMYLKKVGYGHIQNIHGVRNLLYMVPQRSLIPEEHHGTTWVGERTVDFIHTNAGRHPWFLWAGWIAPHPPFDVPDTFADLYKDRDIPPPRASETEVSVFARNNHHIADLPAGRERETIRRMQEVYYAQVSLVDKQVGKILDALEQTGQLDNTLVFYTSDHGEMLGDHGCFQKGFAYDGSSRVPFLVRYPPRIQAGTVSDAFVDLNDILPTALDVAGIPYPGPYELPGGSLFCQDKDRTYQYVENGGGPGRRIMIRDRTHKYVYYYGGAHEELFDVADDPDESVNLLLARPDDGAVREIRERLRRVLWQYEHRWGLHNYAQPNGDFLRMQEPDLFNKPNYPLRNGQFQTFHLQSTDPAEREAMNTLFDEVVAVVKDESVVRLHELDLRSWEIHGVDRAIIERIRAEKL